jgi:hypothetical protein
VKNEKYTKNKRYMRVVNVISENKIYTENLSFGT